MTPVICRKGPFGQPGRHQGGRKGLIGRPARHQGGTREKRQERTNGTACEAPGRQERTNWTAYEAPGRQERTSWTAWEAPGRQDRTNWTAWEAPGRQEDSQQGTREAGKDHLDCYERAQAWPAFPKMVFRVIIFIRDKARRRTSGVRLQVWQPSQTCCGLAGARRARTPRKEGGGRV